MKYDNSLNDKYHFIEFDIEQPQNVIDEICNNLLSKDKWIIYGIVEAYEIIKGLGHGEPIIIYKDGDIIKILSYTYPLEHDFFTHTVILQNFLYYLKANIQEQNPELNVTYQELQGRIYGPNHLYGGFCHFFSDSDLRNIMKNKFLEKLGKYSQNEFLINDFAKTDIKYHHDSEYAYEHFNKNMNFYYDSQERCLKFINHAILKFIYKNYILSLEKLENIKDIEELTNYSHSLHYNYYSTTYDNYLYFCEDMKYIVKHFLNYIFTAFQEGYNDLINPEMPNILKALVELLKNKQEFISSLPDYNEEDFNQSINLFSIEIQKIENLISHCQSSTLKDVSNSSLTSTFDPEQGNENEDLQALKFDDTLQKFPKYQENELVALNPMWLEYHDSHLPAFDKEEILNFAEIYWY